MHNKPDILISTQPEWCEKIEEYISEYEVEELK